MMYQVHDLRLHNQMCGSRTLDLIEINSVNLNLGESSPAGSLCRNINALGHHGQGTSFSRSGPSSIIMYGYLRYNHCFPSL